MKLCFPVRRTTRIGVGSIVILGLLAAFNNCGEGFGAKDSSSTQSESALEFIIVDPDDESDGRSQSEADNEAGPSDPISDNPGSLPPVGSAEKVSLSITGLVLDPGENFDFEVKLSEPLSKDLKISFETLDGTAKAREDYLSVKGELVLAQGETRKSIHVIGLNTRNRETQTAFKLKVTFEYGGQTGTGEVEGKIRGLNFSTPKFIALDDGYPQTTLVRFPCGVTTDHQLMCWGGYQSYFYRVWTVTSLLPGIVPTPEPIQDVLWIFDINWRGDTHGLCVFSVSGTTYCHKSMFQTSQLVDFGQMPNWVKMEGLPKVEKVEGLIMPQGRSFCYIDTSAKRRCYEPSTTSSNLEFSLSEKILDPSVPLEFQTESYGCALRQDGVAECDGRPRVSGNWREVTPVRFTDDFDNTNIQSWVTSSGSSGCFLLDDGVVSCPSYRTLPIPPSENQFEVIAADSNGLYYCGIHQPDRRVSCWGSYYSPSGRVPYAEVSSGLKPVDIVLGTYIGCLLNEDKKVYCWANGYYQGGDIQPRPEMEGPHPLFSKLGPIEKIVKMNVSRFCVLTQTGSIYCISFPHKSKPDESMLVRFGENGEVYKELIATSTEICATQNTGHVTCWETYSVRLQRTALVSAFFGASKLLADPNSPTKCGLFAHDVLKCKGAEVYGPVYHNYNSSFYSLVSNEQHYFPRVDDLFQVRLTKPKRIFVGAGGVIAYLTDFGSLRRIGNLFRSPDTRYPVMIPQ